MKIVIQRVKHASVEVDGQLTGSIQHGLLLFLGVGAEDQEKDLSVYVNKITKLRIFEDAAGKTNLSIQDVGGALLVVSQFTLYADCSHGNRPGFTGAMEPVEAKRLYDRFLQLCREQIPVVESGIFGADMKVDLLNDGPFTILLDNSLK